MGFATDLGKLSSPLQYHWVEFSVCHADHVFTWLEQARDVISVHPLRFTGTPIFTEEGTSYIPKEPNEPKYVGSPSPEIDSAWDALTSGKTKSNLICFTKGTVS